MPQNRGGSRCALSRAALYLIICHKIPLDCHEKPLVNLLGQGMVCYTALMKRIAICDDEPRVLSELQGYIQEYSVQNQITLMVSKFTCAEQLLCSAQVFDLLILDIRMQGINGMDAAKQLHTRGRLCAVIFLTALKDYVFDAFEVDAVNYLLKPIDRQKLFDSMDKVLKKDEAELLIKQGHDYRKIRLDDILYFEAMGRKVVVYLETETLEYYQKFQALSAQLSGSFVLPHRSFLVNLDHVKAIGGNDVVMDDGSKIPIAKGRKEKFAQYLLKHFQRDKL